MSDSILTLLDLVPQPEFLTGLIVGVLGLVVLGSLRAMEWPADWGIVLTAATVIAIYLTVGSRHELVLGVLILVAGTLALWYAGGLRQPVRVVRLAWILLVVGSIVVSTIGGLTVTTWVQFSLPALILLGGYYLREWQTLPQRHLVGPLFMITAAGMWLTVPDTDTARAFLGVALPLTLGTMAPFRMRIVAPGAFAISAVVVWIAATGGHGREASIFGAVGNLGLLAVVPMLGKRAHRAPSWSIVVGHTIFVLVSSRVIGLWGEATPAAAGVAVLGAVAYGVLLAITPPEPAHANAQGPP